ncbi:unnamed protein product [Spirodela intermedia]|uniref:K Homology domain-containing protein n=1 Tax=Spirodela intermedia TaxID=51605 RepID=A0A7I8IQ83_SPIIN|nr:unnamed protein product [Spirodela intermedia]CAA6659735.1 unnamed protein product [Spirodela intermedia]
MAGQRNNYGKRPHPQMDYNENGGSKRRNPGDDRDSYAPGPDDTVYRYLCPGGKIGSIIGRGGEIVKQLRSESQSKIRIGETIPGCEYRVITIFSSSRKTNTFEDTGDDICPAQDALFKVHERLVADEAPTEENPDADAHKLLFITGEAPVTRKALFQISNCLHDNPSRSQHLLASASLFPPVNQFGGSAGGPVMGPIMTPYGGYRADAGADWTSFYPPPRDESSSREFSLRWSVNQPSLGVIGKGGVIIKQIRQESGASIKVDSSSAEDDCIIAITAKEFFEDPVSPTIDAAVRLQPRCSEKTEKESGEAQYTTRLLVPTSRIGCLIGKGGSIISEMRRATRANIRILSKENLPKVATEDDEMVQCDLDVARGALIQVTTRLKANFFEREGALSALLPPVPYIPMAGDTSDILKYGGRDGKGHGRGYSSYSGGYGTSTDMGSEAYPGYGVSQAGGSSYGAYGAYPTGRSGSSGLTGPNPVSQGKHPGISIQ